MVFYLAVILITINTVIVWLSLRWIKVNHHKVYFKDLPRHLVDFKILQITDLHNRSSLRKTLDIWPNVRDIQKNTGIDIAVITGDIILNRANQITPHKEDLQLLASQVPTFYIEGNHDSPHYSKISNFMKKCGITCLYNTKATIEHNGGLVDIIGTKDFISLRNTGFAGLNELFSPTASDEHPGRNFTIALTHQPQVWDKFKKTQPNLTLSGHTHGGQIRLPLLPTLYAPRQGVLPKYGQGFYNYGHAKLYVSVGIGATTFPIRFWNRPNIEVFELKGG